MKSTSVLYMSMSLDGFIAGPNDEPANPGGDGFMRLHDWYGFEASPPNTQGTGWGAHFIEEGNATGAVLAGRRTVEQVDHWGGNHHGENQKATQIRMPEGLIVESDVLQRITRRSLV